MAIQKRLTCDPCLGVSDIMAPFLQYFKEQGKYDMRGLIKPKVVPTWETAPDPEWLASLHPLWMKVLRVAPACILPSKKLKDALEKIQREITRLNFSKVSDEIYFDNMDTLVRISASQLRILKKDSAQYQRTMKKASISQKEKVDELLSCIVVPDTSVGISNPAVDSGAGPQTLPVVPAPSNPTKVDDAPAGQEQNIFLKILQKQPSDPSEPRIIAPVTLTLASSSSQTPGTSEAQGMKVHMGSSSSVRIDLAFDEKELLANALALKIPDKKAKKPRRMLKSVFW